MGQDQEYFDGEKRREFEETQRRIEAITWSVSIYCRRLPTKELHLALRDNIAAGHPEDNEVRLCIEGELARRDLLGLPEDYAGVPFEDLCLDRKLKA